MTANWIDAVLSAVLLLSIALATFRGFMHSAITLAAVVVAFTLALAQGDILLDPLNAVFDAPGVSAALSHAVVFVAALLVFGALGKLIRKTAARLDLGGLDRFIGFLFGLLRGGLIVVVIVLVFGALPVENSKAWKESAVTPVAGTVAFLFLGKGGMLETNLWRFDKRNRPSLNVSALMPSALRDLPDESLENAAPELRAILGDEPACGESEDAPCAE